MKGAGQANKVWLVAEFDVEPDQEELASWLMVQLGANGCEVDEGKRLPDLQPGDICHVKATFEPEKFGQDGLMRINAAFDEYGLSKSVASLKIHEQVEEDWLAKWKEGFEPLPIGGQFLICPPWHEEALSTELTEGRYVILIEPGMAFGTGFHATTQFCLTAIEEHHQATRVLDVGCGSGILSIAYAFINSKASITALEVEETACRVAEENFEINGVTERITLMHGSTELLTKSGGNRFEAILSNLTYEDIAALLPDYMSLLEPGGIVVMSGILKEKLAQMLAAIAEHGLVIESQDAGEKWCGLVVRKPT